jgi:hypothetical protein
VEDVETASLVNDVKDVFAFPGGQLADNENVGAAALRYLIPVTQCVERWSNHPPCALQITHQ